MTDTDHDPANLRLPPILTPYPCAPAVDPFAEACRLVTDGALGAADVVVSGADDVAAFAIVLEPEVGRATALQMAPLMMVAVGDAVGALMPPKVAVHYRWPGTVLVNGARTGHVNLAAAPHGDPPDWIVIGVRLNLLTVASGGASGGEPGDAPDVTTLAEEGGTDFTSHQLISSIAAHFLSWLDIWSTDGFAPVEAQWRFRAEQPLGEGELRDRLGLENSDAWLGGCDT